MYFIHCRAAGAGSVFVPVLVYGSLKLGLCREDERPHMRLVSRTLEHSHRRKRSLVTTLPLPGR